jgi:hypothetical protein
MVQPENIDSGRSNFQLDFLQSPLLSAVPRFPPVHSQSVALLEVVVWPAAAMPITASASAICITDFSKVMDAATSRTRGVDAAMGGTRGVTGAPTTAR